MVKLQDLGRAESPTIEAHLVDESVEVALGGHGKARRNTRRSRANGPIGYHRNGSDRTWQPSDLLTISVDEPVLAVVDARNVDPHVEVEIVEWRDRCMLRRKPRTCRAVVRWCASPATRSADPQCTLTGRTG